MSAGFRAGNTKVILIVVLCLLIVGMGAGAYILFSSGFFGVTSANASENPEDSADAVIPEGVTVAGVTVGGMTLAEAKAAVAEKESELLRDVKISFTVGGKPYDYAAEDLGIGVDAESAVSQALAYEGNEEEGAPDYGVSYVMDEETARNRLTLDSASMNVAPVDATVEFKPKGKEPFAYTDEVNGLNVKVDDLVTLIGAQVNTGGFKPFEAPVEVALPTVTAAQLKLLTSPILKEPFTSYYKKSPLNASSRVYNIDKLSDLLNGTIIQPGKTLSLNDIAGPRTTSRGWKKAPGITDGRYESQAGGGVCQVSGTLYNAALRAELEVVDRTHHSWPSSYLDVGMDATISTPKPDLKIKNPYDTPVYIVSIADTKAKSLSIQIYGKPLAHGYTVDFVVKRVKWLSMPATKKIESDTDLEGNPIKEGKSVTYTGHRGQVINVYKVYKDADGKTVKTELHHKDTYRSFAKRVVTNPKPEPETPETPETPSPPPSPSPSPSPPPSPPPSPSPSA